MTIDNIDRILLQTEASTRKIIELFTNYLPLLKKKLTQIQNHSKPPDPDIEAFMNEVKQCADICSHILNICKRYRTVEEVEEKMRLLLSLALLSQRLVEVRDRIVRLSRRVIEIRDLSAIRYIIEELARIGENVRTV